MEAYPFMFGKMMNRFYYGKSGKGDYTKDDLPETRWQLFWEMLRVRFSALFKLNLMYVVAWLPAILIISRALMMGFSGMSNLAEMQVQASTGEITAEELAQFSDEFFEALKSLLMQTLVLLVPALAITGPATAGVAYVTRNWARDEHAFIWADFIDAIKHNWKQALLASTITGFVPLFLYVCTTFYAHMARSSAIFMLPMIICLMLGILWLCSLIYLYPQIVTYDLSFRNLVRNSLIMVVGRLPMTVGLKLLSLVPAAICALVCLFTPYALYALMIYGAYYLLIGFALSRFVAASYSNAVFDRYININLEGVEVDRGLYKEEDDGLDDDENESIDA